MHFKSNFLEVLAVNNIFCININSSAFSCCLLHNGWAHKLEAWGSKLKNERRNKKPYGNGRRSCRPTLGLWQHALHLTYGQELINNTDGSELAYVF